MKKIKPSQEYIEQWQQWLKESLNMEEFLDRVEEDIGLTPLGTWKMVYNKDGSEKTAIYTEKQGTWIDRYHKVLNEIMGLHHDFEVDLEEDLDVEVDNYHYDFEDDKLYYPNGDIIPWEKRKRDLDDGYYYDKNFNDSSGEECKDNDMSFYPSKNNNAPDAFKRAFDVVENKYPGIFKMGNIVDMKMTLVRLKPDYCVIVGEYQKKHDKENSYIILKKKKTVYNVIIGCNRGCKHSYGGIKKIGSIKI
jgi:hypothetical protein